MSEDEKRREEEVFAQSLSLEELDAASGGSGSDCKDYSTCGDASYESCVINHFRQIYGGGGFPNCAATVEDGSWCDENDACTDFAVVYKGRVSCGKAWR